MDEEKKQVLAKVAMTIRGLAIDATQAANSGHPGLPMGCAEIGAYLWGEGMHFNPKDLHWVNRDYFVLSAGHGCLLQYSCLHLSGYALPLDEIKNFRQLHSMTPGHPEFGYTPGLEVTTGPLGQGVGNSVGMALAYKLLQKKFNTQQHEIFTNKVFCLAGDGCIMEGISSEASQLAGHLGLDNLILLYDANQICLDGPLSETCSEDTLTRYRGYGWEVYEVDGHDLDQIEAKLQEVRETQKKPALVMCRTIIGKGSPHKAGTHKAHGSPLGEEEAKLTKEVLGLPEETFFIPQAVKAYFEGRLKARIRAYTEWQELFEKWSHANPELRAEFDKMHGRHIPDDLETQLKSLEIKEPIAGRSASQQVIALLGHNLPWLLGGSADLSGSDMTMMQEFPLVSPGVFEGRNIKYGVREFAMCAMANGISRTEMYTPFVGTFLVFSDYARNAIRLAALAKYKVIYQFTHDSIFLGEDGPTHQPVEHYMSLRAIPNLHVIRPADANEVKMSWIAALTYHGPTVLCLSRQKLPQIPGTDVSYADGVGRGAYIIRKEKAKPDYTLVATGSEVSLAVQVAIELEKHDKAVRVISMPCCELFDQQPDDYRASVFGGDLGRRVSIEAGVDQGWYKYIGSDGIAICMEGFGASAPMSALQHEFGFTVDDVLERILAGS
jgi:transketolase